jgi:hypothetical protein
MEVTTPNPSKGGEVTSKQSAVGSGQPAVYHGRLGEAEIEGLKQAHGEVHELILPMDDDGRDYAVGYVKKPTRKIIEATDGLIQRQPIKGKELALDLIWIAGDERIKTVDELFYAAAELITGIIKVRQGIIKKK